MEAASIRAGTPQRRRRGLSERRLAVLMVSPSMVLIALVAAYPIGYAIWLSLHEYSVIHPGLSRWVGADNYINAFKDAEFRSAIKNTFIFTFGSVSLELVIGMGMALAMHNAFRGRGLLRTVVLVPWAILTVVTAIAWQTIFEPDLGFANTLLRALHLPGGDTVWLGHNGTAMAVLEVSEAWKK